MIKVYLMNKKETKLHRYKLNPLEGSLEMMVGLEDKYGDKYKIEQTADVISKYFMGATLYLSKGLWEGKLEKSVVIHIVNDSESMSWEQFQKIGKTLLKELQKKFRQDTIMYRFVLPAFSKYKLL